MTTVCDESTTLTLEDVVGFNADIVTINDVVESPLLTTTTKSGKIRDTLVGRLSKLGYLAPIPYAGGISFATNDTVKTVERDSIVYAPYPGILPFTTSGTWVGDDETKFYPIQDEVFWRRDTIAELRAFQVVEGAFVEVRGYYAFADIDSRYYYWDAAATEADDGGAVIKLNGWMGAGRYRLAHGITLDPRWWGVVLDDNSFDSSTQLQNCWAYAQSLGLGRSARVDHPPGKIYCNEVSMPPLCKLVCAGAAGTLFVYNGPGGAGTTTLRMPNGGPFDELKGFTILGGDTGATVFSEHCLVVETGVQIDNQAVWFDLQFGRCLGNSIHLQDNAIIVNWHLRLIRWDSVGGYCISMPTGPTMDTRTFSLTDYTIDNSPLAGAPTPQPGHWGLGVLRVRQNSHIGLVLNAYTCSARIELTHPLIDVTYGDYTAGETPALFYFEHAAASGFGYMLTMLNTHGFGLLSNQAVVHCDSGRVVGSYTNVTAPGNGWLYIDGTGVSPDASVKGNQWFYQVAPELQQGRSFVRVRRSVDQTGIAPGVYTKVEYNNVQSDDNSEYDPITDYQTTIKRPGIYNVRAKLRMGSIVADKEVRMYIQQGPSIVDQKATISTGEPETYATVEATLSLVADETIQIYVTHDDTVNRDIIGGDAHCNVTVALSNYV